MTSIGILSDTHYQDRLFALPDKLASIWAGVSLILHAGDVGDLSALDELGQIAPVVAVHGNDEPEQNTRLLPFQQLLTVNGRRIVLVHGHHADPAEERAARYEQRWLPKLDYLAGIGGAAGAQIVVYGHTHVPMRADHQGVALFNPGALAAGSYFMRTKSPQVARLEVAPNGAFEFKHFNVLTGQPVTLPKFDTRIEFGLMVQQYQSSLVEPGLLADLDRFRALKFEHRRGVVAALVPVYRRCVSENSAMRRADLIAAMTSSSEIAPADRDAVVAVFTHAADETVTGRPGL